MNAQVGYYSNISTELHKGAMNAQVGYKKNKKIAISDLYLASDIGP